VSLLKNFFDNPISVLIERIGYSALAVTRPLADLLLRLLGRKD
jgi:hypothetical protein